MPRHKHPRFVLISALLRISYYLGMPPLLLLLLSLVPLAFAPLLASWAGRSVAAFVALDAFVAVTIAGVAVSHILPEAIHEAGWWALAIALIGFLLPIGLHLGLHKLEAKAMPALVAAVLAGLALHAVADGVALVSQAGNAHGHDHATAGTLLPTAVVLHRLPEALAIWWFARPVLGRTTAVAMLLAIGSATLAGFFAASHGSEFLAGPQIALVHAFVVGMLFHVLLGHHRPKHDGDGLPTMPLIVGGGAGVAFLVAALVLMPSTLPAGPMRTFGPLATMAVVIFALVSRTGRGAPHTH